MSILPEQSFSLYPLLQSQTLELQNPLFEQDVLSEHAKTMGKIFSNVLDVKSSHMEIVNRGINIRQTLLCIAYIT